ncbi:hypothetical protein BDF14DRAFT_1768248 [Spinellus fusiger]|nr:hypothetical protein BDF14DRAFT_1768248 [Spinellus fusiger]
MIPNHLQDRRLWIILSLFLLIVLALACVCRLSFYTYCLSHKNQSHLGCMIGVSFYYYYTSLTRNCHSKMACSKEVYPTSGPGSVPNLMPRGKLYQKI